MITQTWGPGCKWVLLLQYITYIVRGCGEHSALLTFVPFEMPIVILFTYPVHKCTELNSLMFALGVKTPGKILHLISLLSILEMSDFTFSLLVWRQRQYSGSRQNINYIQTVSLFENYYLILLGCYQQSTFTI